MGGFLSATAGWLAGRRWRPALSVSALFGRISPNCGHAKYLVFSTGLEADLSIIWPERTKFQHKLAAGADLGNTRCSGRTVAFAFQTACVGGPDTSGRISTLCRPRSRVQIQTV